MVNKKYSAFISYSNQDRKWAAWLHKAMETYKLPKTLVNEQERGELILENLYPVFWDREELSSSSDLGRDVERALMKSRYLIVICSPRSAKSRWVNEEIVRFKKMGKAGKILCLIIDGEPNCGTDPEADQKECFPPAIRYGLGPSRRAGAKRPEPAASDARRSGDGRRNAFLKIAAGILGVGFDSLKQRDQVRRIKRLRYLTSAAMVLVGVLIFLSMGIYRSKIEADKQRKLADERQFIAEKQATKAQSLLLTNISNQSKSGLLGLSVLLSLIALEKDQNQQTQQGLINALVPGLLKVVNGHQAKINDFEVDLKQRIIITASADATVKFWDLDTQEYLGMLKMSYLSGAEGGNNDVEDVGFNSLGELIVLCRRDALRIRTLRQQSQFPETGIRIMEGDGFMTEQQADLSIEFIERTEMYYLTNIAADSPWEIQFQTNKAALRSTQSILWQDSVTISIYLPSEKKIFLGTRDGSFVVLDTLTLYGTERYDAMAYSPDGKLTALVTWGGKLKIYDNEKGRLVEGNNDMTLPHGKFYDQLVISPDSNYIVWINQAGRVCLFDSEKQQTRRLVDQAGNQIQISSNIIPALCFSVDSSLLKLTFHEDGELVSEYRFDFTASSRHPTSFDDDYGYDCVEYGCVEYDWMEYDLGTNQVRWLGQTDGGIRKLVYQQNAAEQTGSFTRGKQFGSNREWSIEIGMHSFPNIPAISNNIYVIATCLSALRYAWGAQCSGITLKRYDMATVYDDIGKYSTNFIENVISPEQMMISPDEKTLYFHEGLDRVILVDLGTLTVKKIFKTSGSIKQIALEPIKGDTLLVLTMDGLLKGYPLFQKPPVQKACQVIKGLDIFRLWKNSKLSLEFIEDRICNNFFKSDFADLRTHYDAEAFVQCFERAVIEKDEDTLSKLVGKMENNEQLGDITGADISFNEVDSNFFCGLELGYITSIERLESVTFSNEWPFEVSYRFLSQEETVTCDYKIETYGGGGKKKYFIREITSIR